MLRDEIFSILVAGRDTVRLLRPALNRGTNAQLQTASTLTFVVFLLSLHQEVFDRLRAEVLEVVGPTERPTYEHIREMKYLRAVLNGLLPIPWTMNQF